MIALAKSGINVKTFPTFKGLWKNTYERGEKRKEKEKLRGGGGVTVFLYQIITTV